MNTLTITAETYDQAVVQALEQTGLPRIALTFAQVEGLGEFINDREERNAPEKVTLRAAIRPEYAADMARDHLLRMLNLFGVQAEIRTVVEKDIVKIKIRTGDSAILIGHNGQTLEAFQHLLNRMSGPRGLAAPFLSLDVEDYLERKIARLERMAHKAAEEAVQKKGEVDLEPMSAADRKIIHLTLRSNTAVSTTSRGDEPQRRVVVTPV